MNQITYVGKIVRVFGTQHYVTKNGEGRLARRFWAAEAEFNTSNRYQDVLEFEINHSETNPSSNVAGVGDLDAVKQGHIVRFVFKNKGSVFTNSRTGEQQVWNKLLVCSRIELLESKQSYYSRNIKNAVEGFQKKQLLAAKAQAVAENRDPDDVSV